MIKKILFSVLALLSTSSVLYCQQNQTLRDVVVIVRPVYNQETLDFLSGFSKSLRKYGYPNTADLMDAYAKGGFGTGFIYKNDSLNKYYVLTNRHVVTNSEKVDIEISRSGKITDKYPGCEVLIIHKDLDLALIALPANKDFENTLHLNFSSQSPEDGMDVFSAGFPGLGSDPSWQLGKGIISNSEIYIDELTNGVKTGLIQHTAQVDPGSSGGPLLLQNDDSPFGFEIIGINTWKAFGRENVNISIPSKEIITFFDDYFTREDLSSEKYLRSSIDSLISSFEQSYKKVLPYISHDYTLNFSAENLNDLMNAVPKEVKEEIIGKFNNGSPIEGLRIGLADALFRNINSKPLKLISIENFNPDNGTATVVFDQNGKEITSEWKFEQGSWRIKNMSSLKMSQLNSNKIDFTYNYKSTFRFGFGIPISSDFGNFYELSYEGGLYKFLVYDYTLGTCRYNVKRNTTNELTSTNHLLVGVKLGGQIPVKLSTRTYMAFFFKCSIGGILDPMSEILPNDFNLNYGFHIGSDFAYKFGRNSFINGGVGFGFKIFKEYEESNLTPLDPLPVFDIHLGISF